MENIVDDVMKSVVQEVKVEKVAKAPKINLDTVVLPAGVKAEVKKSFVKYSSETRKAVLKSSTIEFDSVIENLDARVRVYTAEEIKKAHLGKMKAKISKIKDSADLQVILDKYYI
jgi:hypothetical protein